MMPQGNSAETADCGGKEGKGGGGELLVGKGVSGCGHWALTDDNHAFVSYRSGTGSADGAFWCTQTLLTHVVDNS